MAFSAISTVPTGLTRDIRTIQRPSFKTIFSGLLLGICWYVSRSQERVDDVLILADSIAEHASMVAVVVETPLNFNSVSGRVGDDWFGAPISAGIVVINADAGIVATWATATDLGGSEVRPRGDRLEDSTLGA